MFNGPTEIRNTRVKITGGTVCKQCKNSQEVYADCGFIFCESDRIKPRKILVCDKFPVDRKIIIKTDWVDGEQWREDVTSYPYFFKECSLVNLTGNCPLYSPK